MAVDPQGRLVVVGSGDVLGDNDVAVARYQPDGLLDLTFDGDGKRNYDVISGDQDLAEDVAMDSQGRIVVVGQTDGAGGGNWVVMRLLPSGDPDPSFNGIGTSVSLGPGSDIAHAVAVDASDRIVVAGETTNAGGKTDVAVARFKTDGTLDSTFDGDGKLITRWQGDASRFERARDVVIDAQGRILVTGGSDAAGGDMTVARYLDNGTPDASFGTAGVRRVPVGPLSDDATALILDPQGRVVVGGSSTDNASTQFTLLRLTPDGALDPSFGGDGIAREELTTDSTLSDVAIDFDGRIVASGWSSSPGSLRPHATVARYDSAGKLDLEFGTGGVTIDRRGENSWFYGMVIDPRDGIVASGTRTHDNPADGVEDFITSRFIDDARAPGLDVALTDGAFLNNARPAVEFSASEPSTFGCGFDTTFELCVSPYMPAAPLSEGQHTLKIEATDRAGNITPVTRTVTVDTVPPDVHLKGKRKVKTDRKKTKAKFKIKVSEPVTLTCHVDRKPPKPCDAGKNKTPKLKGGKHRVFVEAVDQAGNTSSDKQKVKVVAN